MDYVYLPIIIFTLIILFYVTFQDIKYREINIVSLIVLSIVSLIYLGFFIFKKDVSLWYSYFIQLGVTFVFLLVFYILGKISDFVYIGEGDLYTIMALSFTNVFNMYFPMFVFFFALFLTLLIPIFIFLYNLLMKNFPKYSFFNSIYLMFLGYPLKINKITKFYTPLETFSLEEDKIKSKIIYKPIIEPEKEINLLTKFAKKNNILKIWVSPLIPFIILILLSYILVVFFYTSNFITFIINLFI
jgi:hypothetical protein